jgi:hypothetical protein
MALAAILAAVDGLPEAIRGEYRSPTDAETQANPALKDKFLLDVTPADGFRLGAVDQLTTKLSQTTSKLGNLEAKLKTLPEGISLDDIPGRLSELDTLKALDPAKEADKIALAKVDAVKTDMTKQFDAERNTLKGAADKYKGALDGVMRRGEAVRAISEAGGSVEVLLPHVLGNTKFVETEDGKFRVDVVDADGNTRIGDAGGNPMNLDQLVGEFKTKDAFAANFAASGNSGGGAQRQSGGGGGGPAKKKSEMSLNERADYIASKGSDAYLSLPA